MSWLDEDFTKSDSREYFLKEAVNTKKFIAAGSILQVTQCLNVSVPRKNRESDACPNDPKNSIIKVTLTDGKSSAQGLITEYHPHLTSSTVPGTKVEITSDIPVVMSLVILNVKNIRVIGGVVPALVEHWKMQIAQDKLRSWGFRGNTSGNDGPPLWKPFNVRGGGGRVDRADLRNVKAMDLVKEQIEVKTDDPSKSKFDAQRLEAISELAKQTQLKSFGEGKRLVDKGILDIVNEGFSEEQAEEAIRRFKNPKKALKFLKNSKENNNSSRPREEGADKDFSRGARRGGRRKGRDKDDDDDGPTGNELGEQPSNSINLFGFIQQKIKTEDEPASRTSQVENFQESFGNSNSGFRGRGDRHFRKDGEARGGSQYQDSRNGYRRNDNGRPPGRYNDAPQEPQESRDSLYGSGQHRRGNFQRSDRGGRESSDNYDSRQYTGDSYHQNDARNYRSDRYGSQGGSQQGNHRQSAPPQRNFPSNQRKPEVTMEFTNSSQFPSLDDEFASRPRSMHGDQRTQRKEPIIDTPRQDQYRGGDNNSFNYNRYGQDNQYRQPQGHQTYPTRNREYDGYDRNPRQYPDRGGYRGGRDHEQHHYDQRYNQVEQKFQNMGVRSEYGNEGDWRPSQTMVFTRSRNPGGGGGGGGGGNPQGRHREYAYKDRQQ
ncbi:unnamed protein product [Allacma fusca]|uniref:RecQ mediated genome instability protein 1 OB-fold domain-containing protein n=1 Tax=Allacma fusca TaxID=39272 RepID=A0A8J2K9S7_9HEXA|nr:unnamed protein product [Allacma fusca]